MLFFYGVFIGKLGCIDDLMDYDFMRRFFLLINWFLWSRMMWFILCVRFRLCVVIIVVNFLFFVKEIKLLNIVDDVLWLRFFVGLFVSNMIGWLVKVFVIVMCCCLFLESCMGWWFSCWFRLSWERSVVVLWCVFEWFFVVINWGKIIFLRVENFGSRWWNW